jgi:phage recombination protein Bet
MEMKGSNKHMNKTNEITTTKESKFTEYVPFGAEDKIKLSVDMVKNLIAVKTKTGKTCSDNDAIKFIAMCLARKLNPFEGDAFLIGYDGKDGPVFSLITAHQAFLKRAELHPEYNGMKSGVIVKRIEIVLDLEGDFYLEGDEILGGWATVFFKTRDHPMHKRIRLQRFKKNYGIWMEDPGGMIVKCAEADALRSSFPTMLGGLYLREEVHPAEPKVSTPIFTQPPKPEPPIHLFPHEQNQELPGISSPLDVVHQLCKQDAIGEGALLEFLKVIGLAADETSLDQIPANTLLEISEQWHEYSTRIREANA